MSNYRTYYASPLGDLLITSDGQAITGILFTDAEQDKTLPENTREARPDVVQHCIRQLDEYFAGTRESFALPIAQKGTDFQQSVWKALCTIPYGRTCSYGALARQLGNEKSIRAVGTTNGKNQISIVVPCHRVIGADGSLTGYGGGLWRKKWLLEHEQRFKYGIQTLF